MKNPNLLVFAFLLVLPGRQAHARWSTPEDSPAIYKLNKRQFKVAADGTYEFTTELLIEIKTEEGRSAYGTSNIQYNSRTTEVKDLSAETRNGTTAIPVKSEYIEDKPVASSPEGFDETRKIAIAFPKVEVGSQLYLKYKQIVKEIPFANFFSLELPFGTELLEEKTDITIESEIPLFLEVNDPKSVLNIEKKGDPATKISITLKRPVYIRVTDEEEPYLSRKRVTWVVASASRDFGLLGKIVYKNYEQIISAPLPPSYQAILEKAKTKKTLVDKINSIISQLADEVRYLGDWRPTKGGHIPRPLETTANTRFGDCKDYSAALSAILRNMGYPAKVAWVERGTLGSSLPPLALDTAFNHAIVYLKTDERVYWLDPTNFASYAQGPLPDISGRSALVVDGEKSRIEMIPEAKPSDGERQIEMGIEVAKDGDAILNANALFKGRSAFHVTGIERMISKARIDHLIAKAIAEDNYMKWSKIEPYNLTDRIVHDVRIKGQVAVKNLTLRTSAGKAFVLPKGELAKVIDLEPHLRESDFYLGEVETAGSIYRIKHATLVGKKPKDCEIRSPWYHLTRKYSAKKDEITVVTTRELLTPRLKNEDYKSPLFAKFQTELQSCFSQVAIIFK